uniref:Uncharacterized protein n=1 Tax=Arundo donax TaxID=35708 RepID=A0A0A8YQT0_ARUDO
MSYFQIVCCKVWPPMIQITTLFLSASRIIILVGGAFNLSHSGQDLMGFKRLWRRHGILFQLGHALSPP